MCSEWIKYKWNFRYWFLEELGIIMSFGIVAFLTKASAEDIQL